MMEKLPNYGPLNIGDYQSFLEKSKIKFFDLWNTKLPQSGTLSDFKLIKNLGSGAFGKVILVKLKNTEKEYAMKAIEKKVIVNTGQLVHIKNEKHILQCVNFPFLIHLEFFFIDNSMIYFIMPFIKGGQMMKHLQDRGYFAERLSRFYGAQVILGLEYLHFLNIIYRDLKPENILIDHNGYIKLADFGFAKIINTKTYSFCGTPEYIAPEMILNIGYGKSVDWWSLGILLFEMTNGRSPFYHKDHMTMYQMAADLKYFMPKKFSPELKDLVTNILQTDLSKRFGNLKNGIKDIKEHKWFHPIVWPTILNRQITPPFIPKKELFYEKTINQDIVLNISKTNLFEQEFKDF